MIKGINNLFKKLFKRDTTKSLMRFLEEADASYMQCFELKNIKYFEPYGTKEIIYKLNDTIRKDRDTDFGINKYRVTVWNVESETATTTICIKGVSHRGVRVSKYVSMALGDNYTEEWSVAVVSGEYKVADIRRI